MSLLVTVIHYDIGRYSSLSPELKWRCLNSPQRLKYSEWICKTCDKSLKKNQLPIQSQANGLTLIDIPEYLLHLSNLEQHLISQIIPFMKIVAKPRGTQHGIKEPVVLVPSDLTKISSVLPRVPTDC